MDFRDIDDFVARAQLLNISDYKLDEFGVFEYSNNKITLDLWKFISHHDENVTDIEIPEGVNIVVLTNDFSLGMLRDKYKVKFPASLECCGTYNERYNLGCISLLSTSIRGTWYHKYLSKCYFDFSKSVKLHTILEESFAYCSLNELILPDTITILGNAAFKEAEIGRLRAEGVVYFGERCFNNAKIEKLCLGTNIKKLYQGSLYLNSILKELVLANIEVLESNTFHNIETVYLGYDLTRYGKAHLKLLNEAVKHIEENLTNIYGIHSFILGIKEAIDELDNTLYSGIEETISTLLFTQVHVTSQIDRAKQNCYLKVNSLYSGISDITCKVYLYDKTKNRDIKLRNYNLVGSSRTLEVYLDA